MRQTDEIAIFLLLYLANNFDNKLIAEMWNKAPNVQSTL